MAFSTELYDLLIADSSINAEITGDLTFGFLTKNRVIDKNWVVYSYDKTDQLNGLNVKNVLTRYTVSLILLSPNAADLMDLADSVIDYLNGNKTNAIRDLKSTGASTDVELAQGDGIHTKNLEFEAVYLPGLE